MTLMDPDDKPQDLVPTADSLQMMVRAMLIASKGQIVVTAHDLNRASRGEGAIVEMVNPDGTRTVRLTCVTGHERDDPAPGRDVCCRVCGVVVQVGRKR